MAEASLIPKKVPSGVAYYKAEGLGAFFRISLILFIISGAFSGLLYIYKGILGKQLDQQKVILNDLKTRFEPTLITELEHLSNALVNSRSLLNGHVYVSPVFDFLEKNTLPDISFNAFDYDAGKKVLLLSGEAPSYTEVAAQIKIFKNQQNVAGATFSNTALKETGSVNFSASINLK